MQKRKPNFPCSMPTHYFLDLFGPRDCVLRDCRVTAKNLFNSYVYIQIPSTNELYMQWDWFVMHPSHVIKEIIADMTSSSSPYFNLPSLILSLIMLSSFVRSFTTTNTIQVAARCMSRSPSIAQSASMLSTATASTSLSSLFTARWMSSGAQDGGTSIVETCRKKIALALETEDVKVTGMFHVQHRILDFCFMFFGVAHDSRWNDNFWYQARRVKLSCHLEAMYLASHYGSNRSAI